MKTVDLNEKELLEIDGGVWIGFPPITTSPGPYNPFPEDILF